MLVTMDPDDTCLVVKVKGFWIYINTSEALTTIDIEGDIDGFIPPDPLPPGEFEWPPGDETLLVAMLIEAEPDKNEDPSIVIAYQKEPPQRG